MCSFPQWSNSTPPSPSPKPLSSSGECSVVGVLGTGNRLSSSHSLRHGPFYRRATQDFSSSKHLSCSEGGYRGLTGNGLGSLASIHAVTGYTRRAQGLVHRSRPLSTSTSSRQALHAAAEPETTREKPQRRPPWRSTGGDGVWQRIGQLVGWWVGVG